ncbi:hypothetical protein [Microbacterium sp. Root553]|uniref:hypothetical protein n=1 Tax=Microbacterium sp. Root553 TaxID=1736556 RepID=UPI000AE0FAF7|nr:hypothetical protein [Microbacterium sp. Root553]
MKTPSHPFEPGKGRLAAVEMIGEAAWRILLYLIVNAKDSPADGEVGRAGVISISDAVLAQETGVAPRTVRDAVPRLENIGAIRAHRHSGRTTVYTVYPRWVSPIGPALEPRQPTAEVQHSEPRQPTGEVATAPSDAPRQPTAEVGLEPRQPTGEVAPSPVEDGSFSRARSEREEITTPAPEVTRELAWGWRGRLNRAQWEEYAPEWERVHGEPLRVENTLHFPGPESYADALATLRAEKPRHAFRDAS